MATLQTTSAHQTWTAALDRLLQIAQRDTGKSRRVANFLLSWWNSSTCGGFDPTDMWSIDEAITKDMIEVFSFVAMNKGYPDTHGYEEEFKALVRDWRPQLD